MMKLFHMHDHRDMGVAQPMLRAAVAEEREVLVEIQTQLQQRLLEVWVFPLAYQDPLCIMGAAEVAGVGMVLVEPEALVVAGLVVETA